jgi:hypothetical protein
LEFKTLGLQQITQRRSVIDLTVVNKNVTGGLVNHRLVAQRRQILDGQAPVSQPNRSTADRYQPQTAVVRAAVQLRVEH